MIILLEGPEKSGKTTLARELIKQSRALKVDAVHASNRGNTHPQYYADLMALGNASDVLVVVDRAWPSECVYSKLLNRASALMPFEEHRFESDLNYLNGLKYILLPVERREPLDATDIQVPYEAERQMYLDYATAWDYKVLIEWETVAAVSEIITELRKIQQR